MTTWLQNKLLRINFNVLDGAGGGEGGDLGGDGGGGGGSPGPNEGDTSGVGGGGQGGGGEDATFHSQLPEDLRNDPSLADIKDITGLAKGYISAQKMIGADRVAIPGKNATPEQVSEFYNKIGRPEAPDQYEFNKPENLPENFKFEDTEKWAREAFHEAGLTDSQAKKLLDRFVGDTVESIKAKQEEAEAKKNAAVEEMKAQHGDKWDQKLDMAKKAAEWAGGEEFFQFVNESGLGNDPNFLNAFIKIGETFSEDIGITGEGRNSFGGLSPAAAQGEIEKLQRDESFMKEYNTKSHPNHQSAMERMQRLFQIAYPEPKK